MKLKVDMELKDVYGGDGNVRYEPKEKVTLSRTRSKKTVRESVGIVIEAKSEEELKEKKLEPINTFRLEEKSDIPLLRLGGSHGKLWGALKASAKQLYQLGDTDFKKAYKAVVDMIQVSPVWIPLETEDQFVVEGIPQVLKGAGSSMIVQYFDVVPSTRVVVELTFPDDLEPKVRRLLEQLEMGSHFNKRRATIKIKNIKEI